jgi:hypothetical protein
MWAARARYRQIEVLLVRWCDASPGVRLGVDSIRKILRTLLAPLALHHDWQAQDDNVKKAADHQAEQADDSGEGEKVVLKQVEKFHLSIV